MPSLWTLGDDWISVPGSFVRAFLFEEKESGFGDLYVEYIKGAVCIYKNISVDLVIGLYEASSKGKYIHSHIYNLPYTLEKQGRRKL